MLVLALDSTTRQGSVAVYRDGTLLASDEGDPALTHGERLPGDLMRVLERAGAPLCDVDVFAVAAGPGSFTGLRIGIATMQGLALVHGKPLIGVSALEALAASARSPSSVAASSPQRAERCIGVWMDAQRGEVFSALYRGDAEIDPPAVDDPERVLRRWRQLFDHPEGPCQQQGGRGVQAGSLFIGDGAALYSSGITSVFPDALVLPAPSLAGTIAAIAACRAREGRAPAAGEIRPLYIRRPDAELARDRKIAPVT